MNPCISFLLVCLLLLYPFPCKPCHTPLPDHSLSTLPVTSVILGASLSFALLLLCRAQVPWHAPLHDLKFVPGYVVLLQPSVPSGTPVSLPFINSCLTSSCWHDPSLADAAANQVLFASSDVPKAPALSTLVTLTEYSSTHPKQCMYRQDRCDFPVSWL